MNATVWLWIAAGALLVALLASLLAGMDRRNRR